MVTVVILSFLILLLFRSEHDAVFAVASNPSLSAHSELVFIRCSLLID
jgi:hypothetical protein